MSGYELETIKDKRISTKSRCNILDMSHFRYNNTKRVSIADIIGSPKRNQDKNYGCRLACFLASVDYIIFRTSLNEF